MATMHLVWSVHTQRVRVDATPKMNLATPKAALLADRSLVVARAAVAQTVTARLTIAEMKN